MSTSVNEEKSFKAAIGHELPASLLGTAIDWIRDNLNPDQVFESKRLYKFVGNTTEPEEVFSEEQLEKYGKEKGWQIPEKKSSIFS